MDQVQSGPPRRRRSPIFFLRDLLVNKPCQFLILAYTLFMMLLTSMVFMFMLVSYQTGMSEEYFFKVLLPIVFALFLIATLGSFWFSNKVVGPIYRLEKHMESILKGEAFGDLQFRSGDQFQSTAELYNRMLKHLGKMGGPQ